MRRDNISKKPLFKFVFRSNILTLLERTVSSMQKEKQFPKLRKINMVKGSLWAQTFSLSVIVTVKIDSELD